MAKKFLLGCFEVPGYGGASTGAYALFQDLQRLGLEISFVNLISQQSAPYLRALYGEALGNPRGLPNVHNIILERSLFYPTPAHENLERLVAELAPDVMIGIDFIATLLLKASAPDTPILFMTAGCDQAKQELIDGRASGATQILARSEKRRAASKFQLPVQIASKHEAQAVARAEMILANSDMIRELYRYYFPADAVKLFPETLWRAEWICQNTAPYLGKRKPFAERTIDVLFVASLWNRPEKNWALARALILRHPELQIHMVGQEVERVGHAVYHGLLTERAELFALMGNARTVVCPSRLDAAPGVLFEAARMDCNIVASKNCGNWEICHPALLADSLSVNEFSDRIRSALVREYPQDLERFLQPSARELLCSILDVF